jgi:hypothetical protein
MMGVISVLHEDEQQTTQRLYEYAINIAGHELEMLEQAMVEQPDDYPEYTQARTHRGLAEEDLIQKLGDPMALEPYANASNAYAAAIGIAMFLRGVLDGGRIYHAMVMRELPGDDCVVDLPEAAELAEADEPHEAEAQPRPMEPPDAEVDS